MEDTSRARATAHRLMTEWGVDAVLEMQGGYCSVVFSDGKRVLKTPFQGEELTTGRIAAERMSGGAGPLIHRTHPESGSLLMDQILPGEPLARLGLSDAETLPAFFSLVDRLRGLDTSGLKPLSAYLDTSIPLVHELIESSPADVFLHGDLHHFNILRGQDRWWAIDPKGLAGDPAFEAVAFLRNPYDLFDDVADLGSLLSTRIRALAEGLGVDPWRVWAWGLADRLNTEAADDHPWARMRVELERLEEEFAH